MVLSKLCSTWQVVVSYLQLCCRSLWYNVLQQCCCGPNNSDINHYFNFLHITFVGLQFITMMEKSMFEIIFTKKWEKKSDATIRSCLLYTTAEHLMMLTLFYCTHFLPPCPGSITYYHLFGKYKVRQWLKKSLIWAFIRHFEWIKATIPEQETILIMIVMYSLE